jgi:hypothetical protein
LWLRQAADDAEARPQALAHYPSPSELKVDAFRRLS